MADQTPAPPTTALSELAEAFRRTKRGFSGFGFSLRLRSCQVHQLVELKKIMGMYYITYLEFWYIHIIHTSYMCIIYKQSARKGVTEVLLCICIHGPMAIKPRRAKSRWENFVESVICHLFPYTSSMFFLTLGALGQVCTGKFQNQPANLCILYPFVSSKPHSTQLPENLSRLLVPSGSRLAWGFNHYCWWFRNPAFTSWGW